MRPIDLAQLSFSALILLAATPVAGHITPAVDQGSQQTASRGTAEQSGIDMDRKQHVGRAPDERGSCDAIAPQQKAPSMRRADSDRRSIYSAPVGRERFGRMTDVPGLSDRERKLLEEEPSGSGWICPPVGPDGVERTSNGDSLASAIDRFLRYAERLADYTALQALFPDLGPLDPKSPAPLAEGRVIRIGETTVTVSLSTTECVRDGRRLVNAEEYRLCATALRVERYTFVLDPPSQRCVGTDVVTRFLAARQWTPITSGEFFGLPNPWATVSRIITTFKDGAGRFIEVSPNLRGVCAFRFELLRPTS